ncbi:TadE family protein [Kitasatospora sp. NPDC088548]|uniref:TadE family protein n=1 Tax=Kitasatospora sp. NPDC088548 TaxID=3364075 RepID=UPI0037FA18DB
MQRLRRRLTARRDGGRDGGMSSVEFVITTPILFALLFLLVQFSLYFFSDQVVQAAAQAGARKARATADADPGGWRGQARDTAVNRINSLGPALAGNPVVSTEQTGPDTVRVTVQAEVKTVIPWLHLTTTAVSEGPVERFVPDGG